MGTVYGYNVYESAKGPFRSPEGKSAEHWRRRAGLTTEDLCSKVGIHPLTYKRFLKGTEYLSERTLANLADACGVRPDQYLTRTFANPSAIQRVPVDRPRKKKRKKQQQPKETAKLTSRPTGKSMIVLFDYTKEHIARVTSEDYAALRALLPDDVLISAKGSTATLMMRKSELDKKNLLIDVTNAGKPEAKKRLDERREELLGLVPIRIFDSTDKLILLFPQDKLESVLDLVSDTNLFRQLSRWRYALEADTTPIRDRLVEASQNNASVREIMELCLSLTANRHATDADENVGTATNTSKKRWEEAVRKVLGSWERRTQKRVLVLVRSNTDRELERLAQPEFERHPDRYDQPYLEGHEKVVLALGWLEREPIVAEGPMAASNPSSNETERLIASAHLFEFEYDCLLLARKCKKPLEHLPYPSCIAEGVLFWEKAGIHHKTLEDGADWRVSRNLISFVVNECTRTDHSSGTSSYSRFKTASLQPDNAAMDVTSRISGGGGGSGAGGSHGRSGAAGHTRRGHWRNQACGPGYSQHRRVWIGPTVVGPAGASHEFSPKMVHLVTLNG